MNKFTTTMAFATLSISSLFPSASVAADDAKHIPGIFIGATHIESETEFTFGFEYEYKLDAQWGVGAVFERTNDGAHSDGVAVGLAALYYHPIKNVRLGAGIGEERIGGAHPHDETLYRLSASYDFHVAEFGLAPTIAVDFIDNEEAIVFGVAVTRPF
ncbi:hypothetical protein [Thalassotalea euphylliae]|uniref:hypothetical protein n=1 Tax=Thalassotalea euphylliae TaxID=1655234 RepID=UPI0021638CB7|nr:hypothetical protein [Thalassotalea euphylliae]